MPRAGKATDAAANSDAVTLERKFSKNQLRSAPSKIGPVYTGIASSGQQELTTVNALGQTLTMTDRNGSVHTLTYDVLGRVVSDAVTTLGSGVDGAVRRIETAYDGQGNAYLVTSYDAASGGNVVNQVQRAFNGLGQLVTEYQEHGGRAVIDDQRVLRAGNVAQ